jgi:SAM-dependent methyltransferase
VEKLIPGNSGIAKPEPMPVDTKEWVRQLNLSNFVNSYYQYRDLTKIGCGKKILIVGPGQGLDTEVLSWRGYDVTTFDIDETFRPDHIGSVHDMSRFSDLEFDAVIASHVLEHLPVNYLDQALGEIARVARYALIYLPVHGRHMQLRLIPGFKGIDLSFVVNIFNYFKKPDGLVPRYMGGQHYWEVGMRGWRIKDLLKKFSRTFRLQYHYRNRDWLPSYNFVLKSRLAE